MLGLHLLIGTMLCISSFNTAPSHKFPLPQFAQIKSENNCSKKCNSAVNKVVIRQALTLQAWQEDPNLPLAGVPPKKDRLVGYATLGVTFENKTMETLTLHIKKIEVYSAEGNDKLMSLPSVKLTLRPLEIAPQQYKLTRKKDFGNVKQVKGVIIYELDGQNHTLNSPIVNIN